MNWFSAGSGFMIGLASVGLVHLLIAVLRRVDKDQPFCTKCGFNRTGTEALPCPECGVAAGAKTIVMGRRRISRGRLRLGIAMILLGFAVPAGLITAKHHSDRVPRRFYTAIEVGDTGTVKTLMYWFPELADGQYRFAAYGYEPPLAQAWEKGHDEIIDRLLQAGASPDVESYTQPSLLTAAIEARDHQRVGQLLDAGADPDAPAHVQTVPSRTRPAIGLISIDPSYPQTALGLAISTRDVGIIRLLLNAGADPNRTTGGSTHLSEAISLSIGTRSPQIIDLLIESGADIDATFSTPDLTDATPLFFAVLTGDSAATRLLLQQGADPNAVALYQQKQVTPLDMARLSNVSDALSIEYLMLKGGAARHELTYRDGRILLPPASTAPDPGQVDLDLIAHPDLRLEHAERRIRRIYDELQVYELARDRRIEELREEYGLSDEQVSELKNAVYEKLE